MDDDLAAAPHPLGGPLRGTRTRPLAKTSPSGPAISTASSGRKPPADPGHPGRQERAPAPGQRAAAPRRRRGCRRGPEREGDPQLAGREPAVAGPEHRAHARLAGQGGASTPGRPASAITVCTPDQVAIFAAASFEAMPPLPTALPGPPARRSSWWSISTTSSISEASASRRGSAVSRPGRVGEQHEQLRADQVGHQRRQAVVVAEADLLVGHGVVLVDHRDHAEVDQVAQRPPRVQVLRPVHEVERGQQHLAGQDAVRIEPVLPHAHQPVLAHGRHRLEHGGIDGPLLARGRAPSQPAAMAPEVTTTTVWPVGARRGHLAAQPVDRRRRHRRRADLARRRSLRSVAPGEGHVARP